MRPSVDHLGEPRSQHSGALFCWGRCQRHPNKKVSTCLRGGRGKRYFAAAAASRLLRMSSMIFSGGIFLRRSFAVMAPAGSGLLTAIST